MIAKPMSPIRLSRITKGLSLDETGSRIGVSGSFLSRVERGYARLSPETHRALLAALAEAEDLTASSAPQESGDTT